MLKTLKFKTIVNSIFLTILSTLIWVELVGLAPFVGDLELDEKLFWKLHPSILSGVNKLGYRGKPINIKAPKEGLRILALGDSSTYGIGVFLPKYTFSGQLEKLLNEAGLKSEVINLGVPGYTVYQGLKLLEHSIPKFKPDICIFYFGHNEGQYSRTGLADSNRVLIRAPLENSMLPRLFRTARLYQFARSEWEQVRSEAQRSVRVPLKEYRDLVEEVIKVCQRHRVVPIWIEYVEINQQLYPHKYNEIAKEVCVKYNVIFLEMNELKAKGAKAFILDGIHPSKVGHKVIAEAIAKEIKRLDIIRLKRSVIGKV